MASFNLRINGKSETVDVDPAMPLLWVIRDFIWLTGTKFGCGISQCGACTIHMDGNPVQSCVMPVSAFEGKEITTIEGISENNDHPVQLAWIEEQVPQCGYCQSGQIMTAVALLDRNPNPSEDEIDKVMDSVLCRCGTYHRIKKAILKASKS
ncbi:MAG: (2Fe-2S)-binding protein [Bacteroidetes bacterium]|nr:(2Fe-2S)-binding protein [Bacteroidota bacterium]MDA1121197.1 (2Fe-2S)-binding protein [Bacteroidota bacterium]